MLVPLSCCGRRGSSIPLIVESQKAHNPLARASGERTRGDPQRFLFMKIIRKLSVSILINAIATALHRAYRRSLRQRFRSLIP